MPCFRPIRAWYSRDLNHNGKRSLVFSPSQAIRPEHVMLPCGYCVGCQLERCRQWSLRIIHEKRLHRDSAFLTLTYSEKDLPEHGSLVIRDLQLFMKRLRKRRPEGLRFFACGEYGGISLRPHYHVLLLNTTFSDKRRWKVSGDHMLHVSAELSDLWTSGDSYVGDVTSKSAAYVAGYCLQKFKRSPLVGPDCAREFRTMSRRPGLGSAWLSKYFKEAYDADSAIVDGREVPLTRYYDTVFEKMDRGRLKAVKRERVLVAKRNAADNTPERRRVRERVAELNVDRYRRDAI